MKITVLYMDSEYKAFYDTNYLGQKVLSGFWKILK